LKFSEQTGDWEVGDEWTEEVRILHDDAKAREGGYEGPSQLEATLTAAQQAARKAAISRGGSARLCGGRKAVEKQLKKPFAQVTDAELSHELSTLQDDTKAHKGGYEVCREVCYEALSTGPRHGHG
jgi:hypothetical protein